METSRVTKEPRIDANERHLIHTCELIGANSLESLTELGRHSDEVAEAPDRWMPWNYRESLEAARPAA